mgnify:CR=1
AMDWPTGQPGQKKSVSVRDICLIFNLVFGASLSENRFLSNLINKLIVRSIKISRKVQRILITIYLGGENLILRHLSQKYKIYIIYRMFFVIGNLLHNLVALIYNNTHPFVQ